MANIFYHSYNLKRDKATKKPPKIKANSTGTLNMKLKTMSPEIGITGIKNPSQHQLKFESKNRKRKHQ